MFMLFIFCTKVVRADDDDDDDILGELIVDMLTGIAVAACQSNAACNAMLSIIAETPTRREMRRAGGMGLGYGIGRAIF